MMRCICLLPAAVSACIWCTLCGLPWLNTTLWKWPVGSGSLPNFTWMCPLYGIAGVDMAPQPTPYNKQTTVAHRVKHGPHGNHGRGLGLIFVVKHNFDNLSETRIRTAHLASCVLNTTNCLQFNALGNRRK